MKLQKSQIALIALGISNAAYGFGSEIIGPYTIVEAPITATLTSGGGASFNWLNVVNAPVSINEAFTGFSIIADGYANANAGTTIVVTFASGALHNGPGYGATRCRQRSERLPHRHEPQRLRTTDRGQ